jgi:hypothetical protein
MAPNGSLWLPIAPLWLPMSPYSSLWLHMGPYGTLWLRFTPYGFLWLSIAPIGSQWLQMSSYGSICLSYSPTSPPIVKLNFQVEHWSKADLLVVKFAGQAPTGIHESHCPHPLLEPLHGQDVETLTLRKTLIFTVLVFMPSYYFNIKKWPSRE